MAKASIDTGQEAQPVHTRTTGGAEESQAVVIGLDGDDNVIPATLANGLLVDVSRVQGTVPVVAVGPQTATVTTQAGTTTTGTSLKAANTARRGLWIHNDSTATLYMKAGAGATTTDWSVKIPADGFYEFPSPVYTGAVTGVWASATGTARVTEIA